MGARRLKLGMDPELRIPRATYRLQLHAGFTFRDAAGIVPYLAALGVSHLYCSPYLKARAGSTHGYDIVDHQSLNPEIGSRADFDHLVATLERHGMGQVMDIVPNHMGVMGADNAWWLDVLENGQSSAYASYFDIDWQPPSAYLAGKVLLPVLGAHYGKCLAAGDLVLRFDTEAGAFSVHYFQHRFPIGPRSYAGILEQAASVLHARGDPLAARLDALAAAFAALPNRDKPSRESRALRQSAQQLCKRQLADIVRERAPVREAIGAAVDALNDPAGEGRDRLHELLERQAYRLAHWRMAADEINYRRFFDINELAALRMEDEAVFEATHRLPFELIAQGAVHALRIDHPDGLFDPAGYFRRLQDRYRKVADAPSDKPLYVVAEKIVAPFEDLPADWEVAGTTGYRFANVVNGLFVDGTARKRFTRVYESFAGDPATFEEVARRSKALVLRHAMAGELTVLAGRLARVAQARPDTRDYSLYAMRQALSEVVEAFPVYRTYVTGSVSADDRRYIGWAVASARRHSRAADPGIFDFIESVLLLQLEEADAALAQEARLLGRKFQQLTAPVMAKGVEDTGFYIYNRLISLNDVGGDPSEFGMSVKAFHGASADRAARWPHTMLATSTHDNKRSEDVRARIDVLSEAPAAWRLQLARWSRMNRGKKRRIAGAPAPSRNEEYLIYQTLVGSFPEAAAGPGVLESYRERLIAYVIKALREAKVNSSWVRPDEEYEAAVSGFLLDALDAPDRNLFLQDLHRVAAEVGWFGMLNSLSLVLIKLTSPGVPDIYQGNEMADLSLADPDNRRSVDFDFRREALQSIRDAGHAEGSPDLPRLFSTLHDGRAKLYMTWKLLGLRRERPDVFRDGAYVPLKVEGNRAANVVAYARRFQGKGIVAIAGRLFTRLAKAGELPCGEAAWADTRVRVPFLGRGARLADRLNGRVHEYDGESLRMSALWADVPGSVLSYDEEAGS